MHKERQEGTDGSAGSTRAMMERQMGMPSTRPIPPGFGPQSMPTSERPREQIRPPFGKRDEAVTNIPNIPKIGFFNC